MKTVCIAAIALAAATSALAQTTIYKHVDDSGRITYSNKPMKGATVMELEPITTMPTPAAVTTLVKASAAEKPAPDRSEKSDIRTAVAIVTPLPAKTTLAAVQPQVQKRRDEERRRILEQELSREEESLGKAREALVQEQQNPSLVAAVRVAQQAVDPSPAQLVEFRNAIDKASGRIRGLQSTVADHEKNVDALKKELGSLK